MWKKVLSAIENDKNIQTLWDVYQSKFNYAQEYSWNEVMWSIKENYHQKQIGCRKTISIRKY